MPYRPYTNQQALDALAGAVVKEVNHRERLLFSQLMRKLLRIAPDLRAIDPAAEAGVIEGVRQAKVAAFDAAKEVFGKNNNHEE